MTRPSRRAAAAACCAALALQLIAPLAEAATLSWAAASSGFIGAAGNWNPAQVPVAGDLLRFDVGPGPYTVTCTAAVPSVVSHDYRQGTVFIACSQPHNLATQLTVGSGAGQVVTARLQSGTLNSGWSTLVGTGAGADGTFQVIGGTAHLVQNNNALAVFTVGGANGTGTMRVGSGGIAEIARSMDVGLHPGSLGTLRVDGESSGAGAHPSQLLANDPAADLTLGGDSGHGVLEVTDGALAHVARHLVLAGAAADVADMTVSRAGVAGDSRVEVGGDFRVAANTGGAAGGTAHVTLADGASVTVSGTTSIGDANGSAATFTMQAGAQLVTHSLAAPQPAPFQDVSGGLVRIDGGTFSTSVVGLRIPGGADGPDFEMRGGATASFSSIPPTASMVIGDGSFATLALLDTSSMTVSGGRGVLGAQAGSRGTLQVREASTLGSTARLDVGDLGEGNLHVWSRAQATVAGIDVARQPGSVGLVTIRDSQTRLTVTDLLNVGGSSAAAGGVGEVQVELLSKLALTRAVKSGKVWPGSALDLSDLAHLDLTGSLDVAGTFTLANADVDGGTVALLPGGVLSGDGDVNAVVTSGTDTTTRITAGGTLSLGSPLLPNAFVNRGRLEVGAHSVTLRAASVLIPGNTSLAGGQLHLENPATIEPGKRLTGTGTVYGGLTNLGDIVASGPAGLSFSGTLTGTGTGVSGTLLHLLPGTTFTGGGSLDLSVIADAGATVTLTSDLNVGLSGVANAAQLNGRVQVSNHRLELRSATDPVLGGAVTISSGTLDLTGGAARVRIGAAGSLSGTGVVDAPLTVDGWIDVPPSVSSLQVVGAFESTPSGRNAIEVGLASAGFHGRVNATGPLTLAGTFDLVPATSYDIGNVDSILVMTGSSRTGTFSTLLFDGMPVAGEYVLHYSANGVWVVFGGTVGVEHGPGASPLPTALAFAADGSPGARVALELALPAAANARVDVYDVGGRRVATLHDGALPAGRHRFAAAPAGAGVFYARAIVASERGREVRGVRFVTLR